MKAIWWWTAALSLVLLGAGCAREATAPTAVTSVSAQMPTSSVPSVVVVTYTTGFRHGSIDVAERVIAQLGRTSGLFDTAYCRTADDVRRMLTRDGLAGVRAVMFANTTGNLGITDLDAFLDWIATGHGFVGVHSASDTYHDAPGYLAMLGNEFRTHGDLSTVEAVVESSQHPAVAHLGVRYRVFDEIYRFARNNRTSVMPLLTLNRFPLDGLANAGDAADLPLAWARQHGQGRVFYTALGHRDELWEEADFQQHVLGGLRWALDR